MVQDSVYDIVLILLKYQLFGFFHQEGVFHIQEVQLLVGGWDHFAEASRFLDQFLPVGLL